MRRPKILIGGAAVLVVLVVGITQLGGTAPTSGGKAPTLSAAQRELAGSPPPLDALHHKANALLPGSQLAGAIKALHGYPIVVNAWGSWCTPCRQEFPIFQRLSAQLGRRVAFLGLDVQDAAGDARSFLADHPVTYPSYQDFDKAIFTSYGLLGTPSTIFYDRQGRKVFLHSGVYTRAADLRANIKRYAGA